MEIISVTKTARICDREYSPAGNYSARRKDLRKSEERNVAAKIKK